MTAPPDELIVCSLEAWDEIWRRNQLVVDGLLRRHPRLRVLFVEPPSDLVSSLRRGQLPHNFRPRAVEGESGRLWALTPVKPLPRAAGPGADLALCAQLRRAARRLRFTTPTLWVNDLSYAPLLRATGWPSLYDITDDWLLEPAISARELSRRRRLDDLLLREAGEVVVCSPALACTRGATRPVTLIPNGVDVAHFRAPRPRPHDLPKAPVAVYVGTLHDERVDVDLIADLAARLPDVAVALVGPDALSEASRARLTSAGVHLLGPRPYQEVPAYLQHADVVIVPHRVTPFTESLDPIKAYECLAVGRPVVATEVAGFRDLKGPVSAVAAEVFVEVVAERIAAPALATPPSSLPAIDWQDRVAQFEGVLERVQAGPGRTPADGAARGAL